MLFPVKRASYVGDQGKNFLPLLNKMYNNFILLSTFMRMVCFGLLKRKIKKKSEWKDILPQFLLKERVDNSLICKVFVRCQDI